MVPAQNVLGRIQLDTPQKRMFLRVQFGTCSGKKQFLEVQFGTCSEKNTSWGSNLEAAQKISVPGEPVWNLSRKNQFLEVQFGHFQEKSVPDVPKFIFLTFFSGGPN